MTPGTPGTPAGEIVRQAFAAWADGTGGFLDIVDEGVTWTIVGTGPSAGVFHGRRAFVEQAYGPLTERLRGAVRPEIVALLGEGERVAILWNGTGALRDGQTYRNSYAWFFTLRAGRVVAAVAFLDLATFDAAKAGRALPAGFVAAR